MIRGSRLWRAVGLGLAIWFAAAMTIHCAPALFYGGAMMALLFVVGIPITWLTLKWVDWLVRPASAEALPVVVAGVAAATLADGLAIGFAPSLYAGVGKASQFGAAWILWGVGLLLATTLLRTRHPA